MYKGVLKPVKNSLYGLFTLSLLLLSTTSLALPFIITPKAGTQLPVTVSPGQKVMAYYTVLNNTLATRNNNYIKYLPPNTSQVTNNGTYSDTCGTLFNLAGKGQAGDSCTLQLSVSGPVNSEDRDPHHHLFACFPTGVTCAGTLFPLNVSQNESQLHIAYVANFNSNTVSLCPVRNEGTFDPCTTSNGSFSAPGAMALNPQGSFIYVANPGTASVIYCSVNSTGNFGTCNSALPFFNAPSGIAINPSGSLIYIIQNSSNELSTCSLDNTGAIGPCTNTNIGPVQPFGVAINKSGTYIYITYPFSSSVSSCVLNLNGSLGSCTNNLIPTAGITVTLAINPVTNIAYIVNSTDVTYCTIKPDGSFNTCNTMSNLFNYPNAIAINASGTFAYISNLLNNMVSLCPIKLDGSFDVCTDIGNNLSGPDGIALL